MSVPKQPTLKLKSALLLATRNLSLSYTTSHLRINLIQYLVKDSIYLISSGIEDHQQLDLMLGTDNVVRQLRKGCHFDIEKVETVKKIFVFEGLATF